MTGATLLQLFLLINVFFMGALATIAIQHALAHFRPHVPEPEKHPTPPQGAKLPADVRQRLLETAQANFQKVLDTSANDLQKDLGSTTTQLNKQLEKIGEQVIATEMKRYQAELDQLHKQAETVMNSAQSDIETHQTDLKAKLNEEIEAEKQRLLQQIDAKLADAVASFLTETLQHNVDLGAQSAYLTAMLEEHKDEFAREVKG